MRTATARALGSLALIALLGSTAPARGDLLDPNQFAAIQPGTFQPGAGTYYFNGTTLLNSANNDVIATGVVYNGIDVFTFNAINLANGVTIKNQFNIGPPGDPVAFLSKGGVTIAAGASINVGAFNTGLSTPPFPGPGADHSPGAPGTGPGVDLATTLAGGHTGDSGYSESMDRPNPMVEGGGGGGAIEVGALRNIVIAGSILADGGESVAAQVGTTGAQGGGGGGLLIHGNSIVLSGTLSANGGNGGYADPIAGDLPGGNGGDGGLILALVGSGGFTNDGGTIDLAGGSGGPGAGVGSGNPITGPTGAPGSFGQFEVRAVPEPAGLVLLGSGLLTLLLLLRRA